MELEAVFWERGSHGFWREGWKDESKSSESDEAFRCGHWAHEAQ